MPIYTIDPLRDPRWNTLLGSSQIAGIFHTSGWLQALHDTYRYRPVVFTTSAPTSSLDNGVIFCDVSSWVTGRRLVSLPFSDHCDTLVNSQEEARELLAGIQEEMKSEKLRYVEFRSYLTGRFLEEIGTLTSGESFLLHTLSLEPQHHDLFQAMHKDCIQRKIRRAERESLRYVVGSNDLLINQFYGLLIRTRRRHSLPPQPLQWFRNLLHCLNDSIAVHVAYKSDQPVAAMITLQFKQTITYKYGCSDERFANLGGTPFLFWKVIEYGKHLGMTQLDLGRTELENSGLATFKDRLGARRELIQYHRISETMKPNTHASWLATTAKLAFTYLPDSILVASGKLLYRHIG